MRNADANAVERMDGSPCRWRKITGARQGPGMPARPLPAAEGGGSAWESNPPGATRGDPPQVLKTRPNTSSDALPWRSRERGTVVREAPPVKHPAAGPPFRAAGPLATLSAPMQVPALDLRPGYLVSFEGRMCSVVWWNILRNDRRLFVQMRIKDIESGRVQELKEHGDTKFEVLDKEEKDLTHSYR